MAISVDLPDAGPGEESEALARAARGEQVQCAHPEARSAVPVCAVAPASGGSARTGGGVPAPDCRGPSSGRPSGSTTRPSQASLTRSWRSPTDSEQGRLRIAPAPSPFRSPKARARARPPRKPTISAVTAMLPGAQSWTRSPMARCPANPSTSAARPDTAVTRPVRSAELVRAMALRSRRQPCRNRQLLLQRGSLSLIDRQRGSEIGKQIG